MPSDTASAIVLFVAGAAGIWWAGTRLERTVAAIAERMSLTQAFTGLVLLATVTSLPELTSTVTAIVVLNNPTLAVHNLLGGVAMQTGILVLADAAKRRSGALTYFSPRFALVIQAVGLVLLLQLAIVGLAAAGVPTIGPISLWPVLIGVAYGALLYLTHRHRPGRAGWRPVDVGDANDATGSQTSSQSLRSLWLPFAGLGAVVLAGGWVATHSAEVLADSTGLGDAFLGATLLALATSLPEISTTLSAVRADRFPAAISNIFGSNAFDVTLLLLAEMLYLEGSVLDIPAPTVILVAGVGGVMTCVYLWGLLERLDRTIFGIGLDSAVNLAVLAGGIAALYVMP